MRPGICSAGTPAPSSSPAWRLRLSGGSTVAVRSPTPASPEKVSSRPPLGERVVDALAPDLGGGDPGGVEAVALGRRGGEGGRVLGRAGDLDPDDVVGALADEAGAVEDLAELRAQVGVGAAEHESGHAGGRLASRARGRRGRRSRAPGRAR